MDGQQGLECEFSNVSSIVFKWHAEGQARDAIHCRIRPYLDQGGACGAAPGVSAAAQPRKARAAHAGRRATTAEGTRIKIARHFTLSGCGAQQPSSLPIVRSAVTGVNDSLPCESRTISYADHSTSATANMLWWRQESGCRPGQTEVWPSF